MGESDCHILRCQSEKDVFMWDGVSVEEPVSQAQRPKVLLLDTQRMSNTGQRRDPAHYDNEMFLVDAFSIIRCVGENQGRAEQ